MIHFKKHQMIIDEKNSKGKWIYTRRIDGVDHQTRSYILWINLKQRCSKRGSINGFVDFQQFAEWVNQESNSYSKEESGRYWNLDKDIIEPLNKIYSKETCCFVPSEINLCLSFKPKSFNEYPIGVHKHRNKFVAQGNKDQRTIRLGSYEDQKSAHRAWQLYKVEQLDLLLQKYSHLEPKIVNGLRKHRQLIACDLENNLETVR